MARFALLSVIFIVVAVSLQEAIALRCWDCEGSSCGDPFDKNKIPQSKSIECAGTLGMGDPTCVKIKSTSTGQVSRKCAGSKVGANFQCKIGDLMADVCEHCTTDECNAATQYGPVAMIIISIPIAILKIFSA